MFHLLGGIYLGWSLGANDAANVFGTAVTSKMINFLTAALICAGFVVLGATLEGQAGIETIFCRGERELSPVLPKTRKRMGNAKTPMHGVHIG